MLSFDVQDRIAGPSSSRVSYKPKLNSQGIKHQIATTSTIDFGESCKRERYLHGTSVL